MAGTGPKRMPPKLSKKLKLESEYTVNLNKSRKVIYDKLAQGFAVDHPALQVCNNEHSTKTLYK